MTVSTGIISTIAGTGSSGYSGDEGAATSAALNNPWRVALDTSGRKLIQSKYLYFTFLIVIDNVYIADSGNNRIRKVTVSTDIITTIAGTGDSSYSGDGGAATSAALYQPYGVALDASGCIIICHINLFLSLN